MSQLSGSVLSTRVLEARELTEEYKAQMADKDTAEILESLQVMFTGEIIKNLGPVGQFSFYRWLVDKGVTIPEKDHGGNIIPVLFRLLPLLSVSQRDPGSTSNVQATVEVGSMEIQSDNDRSDVPYTDGTSQGARVAMSKSEETFMRRYSAFTKAYQSVDSKFYGTDEENFAAWRMQLVNHLALHNLDDQYTAQVIQACLAGDALTFYLGTYVDEDLTKFTIADVLVGLRDHFYTIEKLERLQEQWEKANFAEFQANNSNISEVENFKSLTQRLKRIQPNLKKPYRSHEMLRDKYKQIMFRHPVYERLVMTPLPTSADALCSKIEALLLHMQPSTVSPKPQLAFTAQQTSRAPMAQPNHSVTLYQERYRRSHAKPQANRARSTPRPISIASASNPRTANGTQLLCDICQSAKHFRRFCPDKEAKRKFYTANSNYMVADFLGSDSSSGADASDSTDDVTHTDLVWLSPSLVLFNMTPLLLLSTAALAVET